MNNPPQLRPLPVPWMISPSDPQIGLHCRVVDYENVGYVTFIASLGEKTPLAIEHGSHIQVVVNLFVIQFARLFPDASQEDTEAREQYDWSKVPHPLEQKEPGVYERSHNQRWQESGQCPDPRSYAVDDSGLRVRMNCGSQFRHYLFLGADYHVEALAQRATWQFITSPEGQLSPPVEL